MAVGCSSPNIIIPQKTNKGPTGAFVLQNGYIQPKRASTLNMVIKVSVSNTNPTLGVSNTSPNIIIPRKTNKGPTGAFMLQNGHIQPKRASTPNTVNKVFEDQENGIVCYRNEKGEVVCEGYDEGPRFTHQPSHDFTHQREIQIPDFQQGRRL